MPLSGAATLGAGGAASATAVPRPLRRRDKLGLSVLVAEDDADDMALIVGLLKMNLAVADFRCVTDGDEALGVLEAGDYVPDMILLDLNMPRMGGLELLERMRSLSLHSSTPVVVLTTSGRAAHVREALRWSAASYIIKPDRVKELEERLDQTIQRVLKGLNIGDLGAPRPRT